MDDPTAAPTTAAPTPLLLAPTASAAPSAAPSFAPTAAPVPAPTSRPSPFNGTRAPTAAPSFNASVPCAQALDRAYCDGLVGVNASAASADSYCYGLFCPECQLPGACDFAARVDARASDGARATSRTARTRSSMSRPN